jgi:hypothetical protein
LELKMGQTSFAKLSVLAISPAGASAAGSLSLPPEAPGAAALGELPFALGVLAGSPAGAGFACSVDAGALGVLGVVPPTLPAL